MYTSFAVGLMLLAGWTLPNQSSEGDNTTPQTSTTAPAVGPSNSAERSSRGPASRPGTAQPQTYRGATSGTVVGTNGRTGPDRWMMPAPPTDPMAGMVQQAPPTEQPNGLSAAATPRFLPRAGASMGMGSLMNQAPAYGTLPYDPVRNQAWGTGTIWQTARTQQADVAPKPFSGYRPSPPVSPYTMLNGSAQNYQTLVRPLTEQRYLNEQYGADISGLGTLNRMESSALQQIHRQQMQYIQGQSSPQYYMMNIQSFYPGFGQ